MCANTLACVELFAGIGMGHLIISVVCFVMLFKNKTLTNLEFFGFMSVIGAFVAGAMFSVAFLLYLGLHAVIIVVISLLCGYAFSFALKAAIQKIMER